jgi:hypothetical protein
MQSEMKEQKHWREVWSATRPLPLSISHVHSSKIDAFRYCVISYACFSKSPCIQSSEGSSGAKSEPEEDEEEEEE